MLHEYARDHVLLCLVPAFFIAGAISVFVSQASVMKYLGAQASKWVAYPVRRRSPGRFSPSAPAPCCRCSRASTSGGPGSVRRPPSSTRGRRSTSSPSSSPPACSDLEIGIARAVGAITFSVVIGLLMHLIFRRGGTRTRGRGRCAHEPAGAHARLWQDGVYFAGMVGVLVFAELGAADRDGRRRLVGDFRGEVGDLSSSSSPPGRRDASSGSAGTNSAPGWSRPGASRSRSSRSSSAGSCVGGVPPREAGTRRD